MKRTMLVTGLVVAAMMVGAAVAQAQGKGAAGGGFGGGKGNHEAGKGVVKVLVAAVTVPALRNDTTVQQLVDKLVTDRKTLLQDETDNVAAYEKLVQAARSGDQNATKAAGEALKAALQKAEADRQQLHEDFQQLAEKVKALHPKGGQDGAGANAPAPQKAN